MIVSTTYDRGIYQVWIEQKIRDGGCKCNGASGSLYGSDGYGNAKVPGWLMTEVGDC